MQDINTTLSYLLKLNFNYILLAAYVDAISGDHW
jgi:hypothetical protein